MGNFINKYKYVIFFIIIIIFAVICFKNYKYIETYVNSYNDCSNYFTQGQFHKNSLKEIITDNSNRYYGCQDPSGKLGFYAYNPEKWEEAGGMPEGFVRPNASVKSVEYYVPPEDYETDPEKFKEKCIKYANENNYDFFTMYNGAPAYPSSNFCINYNLESNIVDVDNLLDHTLVLNCNNNNNIIPNLDGMPSIKSYTTNNNRKMQPLGEGGFTKKGVDRLLTGNSFGKDVIAMNNPFCNLQLGLINNKEDWSKNCLSGNADLINCTKNKNNIENITSTIFNDSKNLLALSSAASNYRVVGRGPESGNLVTTGCEYIRGQFRPDLNRDQCAAHCSSVDGCKTFMQGPVGNVNGCWLFSGTCEVDKANQGPANVYTLDNYRVAGRGPESGPLVATGCEYIHGQFRPDINRDQCAAHCSSVDECNTFMQGPVGNVNGCWLFSGTCEVDKANQGPANVYIDTGGTEAFTNYINSIDNSNCSKDLTNCLDNAKDRYKNIYNSVINTYKPILNKYNDRDVSFNNTLLTYNQAIAKQNNSKLKTNSMFMKYLFLIIILIITVTIIILNLMVPNIVTTEILISYIIFIILIIFITSKFFNIDYGPLNKFLIFQLGNSGDTNKI